MFSFSVRHLNQTPKTGSFYPLQERKRKKKKLKDRNGKAKLNREQKDKRKNRIKQQQVKYDEIVTNDPIENLIEL